MVGPFDPRTFGLVAFDLGSETGAAWWPQGYTRSASLKGTRPARFRELWLQLGRWLPTEDLRLIVFERPFVRGQGATRSGWGMAGIIECYGQFLQLPVLDASVGEIKKFLTGGGSAAKGDMIDYARDRGWDPQNDHEADAAGLAEFTINNLCKQHKLPPISLKELKNAR